MIKVAITGPESSGKTTLALKLTRHFDAILVEEFSRIYLKGKEEYSKEDVKEIAHGQYLSYQESLKSGHEVLISDTEMIVVKIWFEEKFDESDTQIEDLLNEQKFDLYLLMTPDIPWEADPLRENPLNRDYLFKHYKDILDQHKFPYVVIDGTFEERVKKAKASLEAILKK